MDEREDTDVEGEGGHDNRGSISVEYLVDVDVNVDVFDVGGGDGDLRNSRFFGLGRVIRNMACFTKSTCLIPEGPPHEPTKTKQCFRPVPSPDGGGGGNNTGSSSSSVFFLGGFGGRV